MNKSPFSLVLLSTFAATASFAQNQQPAARTAEQILKSVKIPEGYEGTVYSLPPAGGYPTCLSAALDGTLFVGIDQNGSLGHDRNEPGKEHGRVMRMRDTDGDGKADEVKMFAAVESPRGVIWDGASGNGPGTLYVMHPPNLTAYTDVDGDGVSDRQDEILTGLGFDLSFRGADHTTNGSRLGIDGFIYIAVGDYGYVEAKAKDGTTIKNRGGGIVRIRPDGTGLEIVSRGQRNIYDVAVSPTLDLFTRDNTNDGGGWDVRLSFVPPGAHMGYPYLFRNFPEDHVQPLADYGGGSPCGALWLDEPGLQNGLYTVEWGRSAIMYHSMKPKGASWEATQEEWLKLTRPTDMDVDGSGRIYLSSWEGATFNFNGPNAGYLLQVSKKGRVAPQLPDFKTPVEASAKLLPFVGSQSAVIRQTTQRELLRRLQAHPELKSSLLNASLALAGEKAAAGEIGAAYAAQWLFILGNRGQEFTPQLAKWKTGSAPARLLEVRAEGDSALKLANPAILIAALQDQEAEIRAAAITSLRRRGLSETAPQILPLVADTDPIVSHLAVGALRQLKASQTALAALDSSDERIKPGALKVLYGLYQPEIVDGLISRLATAKGELRRGILNALCRLSNQDAVYNDPKVWWGTRPDTSGPVYQPERWAASDKIDAALKQAISADAEEEVKWLVQRMYLTKVAYPGLIDLMLAKAGNDTPAKLTAIEGMFTPDNILPNGGLSATSAIALNEKEAPELRARALRLLQRSNQQKSSIETNRIAAFDAAVAAFAPLAGHDLPHPALTAAFEDYSRAVPSMNNLYAFEKMAVGEDLPKRTLAQTVLVNLATSTLHKGREKEYAEKSLAKIWAKPETAASLLGVIARTKAKTLAPQVEAHLKDPNNAVAEAALFAYQALGLQTNSAPVKTIGQMKYEEVWTAVQKGGDPVQGKEMFLRAGCIACHTINSDEPPKGPILGAVAKIYDRAALTESVLKPNAKIAQGFESVWFKTKKGEQVEGFVVREGGDNVDVRNIAGQTVTLEKGDVTERGKRETSMMPEGLLNAFSPAELANLLAWLESLKTSK